MDYNCKTVSLNKVLFDNKGLIRSLCDTCQTKDCSNNIESRNVSILGVNKQMRVLVKGHEIFLVVGCEGYIL